LLAWQQDKSLHGVFNSSASLVKAAWGKVWLAEQTSPVRRQVALKLIKAGMYDEAVVQRFQSERQSLAIMDHKWRTPGHIHNRLRCSDCRAAMHFQAQNLLR
jgi:hypothetical protein